MLLSKKEQRIKAINARRALSPEQRAAYSSALSEKLAQLDVFKNAGTILAYAATWDEADLSRICSLAVSMGKTVAYPVSYRGGIMEAYAPEGPDCWTKGILGITVPDISRSRLVLPEEIDLVLVPCVAFDEAKRRLGHGGGYYDRYLPKCIKAQYVLVAFEAQKLPEVAADPHDVLMNVLVTEDRVY